MPQSTRRVHFADDGRGVLSFVEAEDDVSDPAGGAVTEDEFEHIPAEEKELSTTADVDMAEYDAKLTEHREQQERDAMAVRAERENRGNDDPGVSTTSPMGGDEDPVLLNICGLPQHTLVHTPRSAGEASERLRLLLALDLQNSWIDLYGLCNPGLSVEDCRRDAVTMRCTDNTEMKNVLNYLCAMRQWEQRICPYCTKRFLDFSPMVSHV